MHESRPDDSTGSIGLAVAAVVALAVNVLVAGIAIWSDAADVIGVEYSVTHAVQRSALGHPLYSDPELPPFSLVQYTPLHYQVCAAAIRGFGLDANDPIVATRVGRMVATTMWTVAAFCVGFWLRRMGTGTPVALALVAWWTTQANPWWFLNRTDSAESMLFILVLAMTARIASQEKTSILWILAAAAASVAIGYAKQNGWMLSFAFVMFLFFNGRRNAAFVFLIGVAAGHAVLHGLAWKTWGSAWPDNIFGALDNGVDVGRAIILAFQPIAYQASALLAAAVVLAWRWRRDAAGVRRWLSFIFGASLVVAAAASLKVGSADNYFIDAGGVAVLILGLGAADLRTRNHKAFGFVGSAFAVMLLTFAPIKALESFRRVASAPTFRSLELVGKRVQRLLDDKPGAWAFIEDSPAVCFLPERTILPQLLLAKLAHDRRRFSFHALKELVPNGEIAVLALRYDLPEGARLLGAPVVGFTLIEATGPWRIYLHQRYPAPIESSPPP
jgi:hypothetical protein